MNAFSCAGKLPYRVGIPNRIPSYGSSVAGSDSTVTSAGWPGAYILSKTSLGSVSGTLLVVVNK